MQDGSNLFYVVELKLPVTTQTQAAEIAAGVVERPRYEGAYDAEGRSAQRVTRRERSDRRVKG